MEEFIWVFAKENQVKDECEHTAKVLAMLQRAVRASVHQKIL